MLLYDHLEQIVSVSRQICTRCVKKEKWNLKHLHIWFHLPYMKKGTNIYTDKMQNNQTNYALKQIWTLLC